MAFEGGCDFEVVVVVGFRADFPQTDGLPSSMAE